jgi:repressor LexA
MTLTNKQQEVLDFIVKFREENQYSPTVGDIMRGLGYKSVPAAKVHVAALIRKGKIRTTPNVSRSIVVL